MGFGNWLKGAGNKVLPGNPFDTDPQIGDPIGDKFPQFAGAPPMGGMAGGGYGAMGLGNMYGGGPQMGNILHAPRGGGASGPWSGVGGVPGQDGYGQPPQSPEGMFDPRELGGLDYLQMGAGALTDIGNWWETRQERLGREERDALDREERQRRRTEMGQAWRAANQ